MLIFYPVASFLLKGNALSCQKLNHPFAMSEYYNLGAEGAGFNVVYHDGHVLWRRVEEAEIMATYGAMRFFR